VVRGSLNSFTWHYYHVQVPYGTSALNITAHQTSRYGDVDVYVQRDRFPTERDYAARDVGTDPDIYLQLPNPAPGRWYIGMYGYWHVDYTLQVDIIGTRQTRLMFTARAHARTQTHSFFDHSLGTRLDQPAALSIAERMVNAAAVSVCATLPMLARRATSVRIPDQPAPCLSCLLLLLTRPHADDRPLNSGVPFTESVATGEWKFFRISTAPNNYLDIVVVEDGAGDVDVVRVSARSTRSQRATIYSLAPLSSACVPMTVRQARHLPVVLRL